MRDIISGEVIIHVDYWDTREYFSCCFSPNERKLLVTTGDQNIFLFDPASSTVVRTFSDSRDAEALGFSPDGNTVYISRGNRIELIDYFSGEKKGTFFTLPDNSYSIAGLSQNKKYVVGAKRHHLKLFGVNPDKEIRVLNRPKHVSQVVLSNDGKTLASQTVGDMICFWSTTTGRLVRVLRYPTHWDQGAIFFGPGENFFALSNQHGGVTVWDTNSWEKTDINNSCLNNVVQATFSPDGKSLALIRGGADQKHIVLKLDADDNQSSLGGLNDQNIWLESGISITSDFNFSADGNTLYQTYRGIGGGVIISYDMKTGLSTRKVVNIKEDEIFKDENRLVISFTPCGNYLLVHDEEFSIGLYSVNSGEKKWEVSSDIVPFHHIRQQVTASIDGKIYAVDGTNVTVFNMNDGSEILQMKVFDNEWVSITPDGYYTASPGGEKYVYVCTAPLNVTEISGKYRSTYNRPDIVEKRMNKDGVKK